MRFFLLELLVVLTPEAGVPVLESFLLRLSLFQCFYFFFRALLEVLAFLPGSRREELFKFKFEVFGSWTLGLDSSILKSLELLALSKLAYTG